MNAPNREMYNFVLLSHDEQRRAIQELAAAGMSDHTIAQATKLNVQMIRRLLAERVHPGESMP
jgi:hypothetical protein